MQIDNKHIKKQFEKSMQDYDQNATVQILMAFKLVFELSKISTTFENILELGSGTGVLTKQIAKELNFSNYFANDLVEKSKHYVKKFIPKSTFFCGNALKIKPPKKVDLIISNAMFQWFPSLEKAIQTISTNLKTDGILAFSTFAPENFKEITNLTGLSLKYLTEKEIEEVLKNQGFEIIYIEQFYEELKFKTPLELLAHMKKTGVNSLSEKTWTIAKVKDFCDKYSKKYPENKLTYSPIIIIAKKK